MVEGVANVWVPVGDIERALDFYQNTLGFSVIKQVGITTILSMKATKSARFSAVSRFLP